jgi:hypothetical protein
LVTTVAAEGIPVSHLATNLRVKEPDGGLDARCVNAPRVVGRLIPSGTVGYQFKSGLMAKSASKLVEEDVLGKGRVLELLRQGHPLVYVAARDRGDGFEQEIRAELAQQGFADRESQVVFIGGDLLARLLQQYPALVARLLGLDVPLVDLSAWSQFPRLRNAFQRDALVEERLLDLRLLIEQPRALVRVVGAAGHGKTRLVLETLRGSELEGTVLYASQPETVTASILGHLRTGPNVRCTLVADEVDDADAERLIDQFGSMPEGVRLVMIGRDASGRAQRDALQVDGLSEDLLVAVVKGIVPGLPDDQARRVARICERSPKLAVLVADRIREDPNLVSHHRLVSDASLRVDLERYLGLELTDPRWRAVAAVALLERVGWRGEVEGESEKLFTALGLDPVAARQLVEAVDERLGIVPRANRFRYVSPTILADHLAARQLREWTRAQAQRALAAMTPAMARSFAGRIRRLAGAIGEESAVEAVLLGDGGPFQGIDDLEQLAPARLISQLAGAFPRPSLRVLKRMIGNASLEQLRTARQSRRELVYALEQLLWSDETFEEASRLLLKLAVAENETWGNNATGLWAETFQTLLGRTAAGLAARLRILTEAAGSTNPDERRLAAQALGAALRVGHITQMGMPPDDVTGIPDREWRPATYSEWWDAIRSYLALLTPLLHDPDSSVRLAVRKSLVEGFRGGITFPPVIDSWLAAAATLTGAPFDERLTVLEAVEREIRKRPATPQGPASMKDTENPPALGGEQEAAKGRLRELRSKLLGDDFSSRFRWAVSHDPWGLEARVVGEGVTEASPRCDALAKEVVAHPELMENEWAWLVEQRSPVPERWVERLGMADEQGVFEEVLLRLSNEQDRAWNLLAQYDLARAPHLGGDTFLDRRIEEWKSAGAPETQRLRLIVRSGHTPRRLQLVLDAFGSGSVPGEAIGEVVFSPWLDVIGTADLLQLAEAAAADSQATQNVIMCLTQFVSRKPEARMTLHDIAVRMLERPRPEQETGSFAEYEWVELAKVYAPEAPDVIATAALRNLAEVRGLGEEPLIDVVRLAWATADKPQMFNTVLAPWIESEAVEAWIVRKALKPVQVESIGVDELVRWVAHDPPRRARRLAEVIGAPVGRPSDLHAVLLERFGEHGVGSEFFGDYISGTWWGSDAHRTRGLLDQAKEWQRDDRPVVQDWARRVVVDLEEILRRAEGREEEERFC